MANYNGPDQLVLSVADNHGGSDSKQVDITVTAINDAPVATITPASYSATEQVALSLKNNGLSISDVDAGSGQVTVTLSVGEGTLTVTAGTSGAQVSGSGSPSVTVSGTVAQINALLNTDGTSTVSYIDNTGHAGREHDADAVGERQRQQRGRRVADRQRHCKHQYHGGERSACGTKSHSRSDVE